MSIHVPQNFYRQTITRAVTLIGATNIYVSALPTPTEGYITISPASATLREIIYYTATGTDGNGTYITVTLANRGLGGTTAQTHVISEPVRMNVGAETIQEISDALGQIVAGGAQDASTTVKGLSKLSVAPVSASSPIAVGDNDPRLSSIIPSGAMVNYASSKAVCIDNFNRPDSSSVGGLWTETDASSILTINSNKLKCTGGNLIAYITQPLPHLLYPSIFLNTATADYFLAASSAGSPTTKVTIPTVPVFGVRFKFNITYSLGFQLTFLMLGDGSSYLSQGYGIYIDNTIIQLIDQGSTIVSSNTVITSGSDYYCEILYLAGGAAEIRVWLTSNSRPSALLTQAARTRTTTNSGNKFTIGFNNGTGTPTFLIDDIYFAYGSGAVTPVTVPTGYLECTGERISRSTYATLYGIIGDVHGSGDGSTTFNLPQDWPLKLQPSIIKT